MMDFNLFFLFFIFILIILYVFIFITLRLGLEVISHTVTSVTTLIIGLEKKK